MKCTAQRPIHIDYGKGDSIQMGRAIFYFPKGTFTGKRTMNDKPT